MIGISFNKLNQGTDLIYILKQVQKAWLKISLWIKVLKIIFGEN